MSRGWSTRPAVLWHVDEGGQGRWGGLRYGSRIGSQECWAVFGGTNAQPVTEFDIVANDTALSPK